LVDAAKKLQKKCAKNSQRETEREWERMRYVVEYVEIGGNLYIHIGKSSTNESQCIDENLTRSCDLSFPKKNSEPKH
jgi:hypothetical protein